MVKEGAFQLLLKQIFQDGDGIFSSKRVVAFIAVAVMTAAFGFDLGGLTVSQFIFDGFLILALGSLGITGAEMIASKIPASKKVTQNNNVIAADADVTVGTPQPEE